MFIVSELIYCGVILHNEKPLSAFGIKNGVMIHAFRKRTPKSVPAEGSFYDDQIEIIVHDINIFKSSYAYISGLQVTPSKIFASKCFAIQVILQRVTRTDSLDTIIAATPGLSDDPIATALIRDPELILQCADMSIFKSIIKSHPSFLEGLMFIVAQVYQEREVTSEAQRTGSPAYDAFDDLSDDEGDNDEDMESASETSAQQQQSNPLTRNTSYNVITAAQLADAILNSTAANFGSNSSLPASPSPSTLPNLPAVQNVAPTTNASSGNVITNEMFMNAMMQAFATSTATAAATATPSTPNASNQGENVQNIRVRLQAQLQQMSEMGLTNESVNLRALQVTSGDVQGAIELVFSGAIE